MLSLRFDWRIRERHLEKDLERFKFVAVWQKDLLDGLAWLQLIREILASKMQAYSTLRAGAICVSPDSPYSSPPALLAS